MPTSERADPNPHLLLHLREICEILATGLVRLRRHTTENLAENGAIARDLRESSLPFATQQSGHAKPRDKERA
jgi:hypothetical protein